MKYSSFVLLGIALLICLINVGCTNQDTPRIVGPSPYRVAPRPYYETPTVKPYTPPVAQPPVVSVGKNLNGRTIIVDPGHGGRDPGAGQVGFSWTPEKSIVLDIAKEVETQLKAKGARVIMTRRTDCFIELDDRAAMATRYKADLLVSIHADSHRDSTIKGPSIYISRNASAQSQKVANSISSSFRTRGIAPLGVRKADFRVLAKHPRPAVLVESGYLTNGAEARNLNTNWYRNKIAACIVDGIANAMGRSI